MNKIVSTSDSFFYEYQKFFIRSLVTGMPEQRLRRVAMYHFDNSRTKLAHRTAELLAGDREKFDDFLRHFPLSWHESLMINHRILRHSVVNGCIPAAEKKSYAVKHILKK